MATASETITEEVTSWPGVEAGPGRRGELSFRVGRREIGHLHGDHAAHFSFPKAVWADLFAAGRVVHHPVFPGKEGPAARRITDEDDVREVIALLRLNYERMATLRSSRTDAGATRAAAARTARRPPARPRGQPAHDQQPRRRAAAVGRSGRRPVRAKPRAAPRPCAGNGCTPSAFSARAAESGSSIHVPSSATSRPRPATHWLCTFPTASPPRSPIVAVRRTDGARGSGARSAARRPSGPAGSPGPSS